MDLEEFITAHSAEAAVEELTIPRALQDQFAECYAASTDCKKEVGLILTHHAPDGIAWQDRTVGAEMNLTGAAVAIPLVEAQKLPNYIGTFHTHPYEHLYGKNIAIGPSTGDHDAYAMFQPQRKPMGLHFVWGAELLFLVVTIRGKCPDSPAKTNYADVPNDLKSLLEVIGEEGYTAAVEESRTRKTAEPLARFWSIHDDLPRLHHVDSLKYNYAYCPKNGSHFYVGDMKQGPTLQCQARWRG